MSRLKFRFFIVRRDKETDLRLYFSGLPLFNIFSLLAGVCFGEAGFVEIKEL